MASMLFYYTQYVGVTGFLKLYFIPYLVRSASLISILILLTLFSSQITGSWCSRSFITPIRRYRTTGRRNGPSYEVLLQPSTGLSLVGSVAFSYITYVTGKPAPISVIWRSRQCQVSHDHIAHHFFSSIPFCESGCLSIVIYRELNADILDHQPEVTKHLKHVLKDDYNYDSTVRLLLPHKHRVFWSWPQMQNTFRALYRSFSECCFIEDDGDIVFYKNQQGEAGRQLAEPDAVKLWKGI